MKHILLYTDWPSLNCKISLYHQTLTLGMDYFLAWCGVVCVVSPNNPRHKVAIFLSFLWILWYLMHHSPHPKHFMVVNAREGLRKHKNCIICIYPCLRYMLPFFILFHKLSPTIESVEGLLYVVFKHCLLTYPML